MRALVIAIMLLGAGALETSRAAEVEQFFMPGELISAHQGLESECTNCHARLRDTTQEKLCLGCHDHEAVAADIRNQRGFHGRDKNARSLACKSCHSDHKGRDAMVVWLDQDSFDHRVTDFRLTGRHQLVECGSCHLEDKKYRDAESKCYACHLEDDTHDGELGKKCSDCHVPNGWARSEFDHDKTDFKLKFKHQFVSCNACHIKGTYKNTPQKCVDCHAIRDVHANRFGKNCGSCHSEKKWGETRFDHNRDTDYPLEGKHRGISCNACHSTRYQSQKKKNKVRSCYNCHRSDDVHSGSNGRKCQDCHTVKGWQQAEFDHDANTDFALNGAHENLVCDACHVLGAKTKEIDTGCYSCHKQDDAHELELGRKCNQCHRETTWRKNVRYDHDLGNYPLIGMHATVACESCHQSSVFSDADNQCVDCHHFDDVHKRALGQDCTDCHNPNNWLIWAFDHDQTDFKLRRAHDNLHCHSCHDKPLKQLSSQNGRCVDCHRRDDVHDGKFGHSCNRCHNDKSFSAIELQSMQSFRAKPAAETRN